MRGSIRILQTLVIVVTLLLISSAARGDERSLPVSSSSRSFSSSNTCSPAISVEGQAQQGEPTIRETFRRFFPESEEIFRSILPWNWNSPAAAIGLGAAVVPLVVWKDDIQAWVDRNEGDDLRFAEGEAIFSRFEELGGRWFVPALSGAFAIGGLATGSQREVETGLMIVQSYLFTAAVTGIGQYILAEDRPYKGGELNFFRMDGHGVSGHSALSASFVRPLDARYLSIGSDDGRALRVVKTIGKGALYTAPVMVAVSRVRSNRHYVWNVVLGVAVGYSVGRVVSEVHEKARAEAVQETVADGMPLASQFLSFSWRW